MKKPTYQKTTFVALVFDLKLILSLLGFKPWTWKSDLASVAIILGALSLRSLVAPVYLLKHLGP